jgi:chromosome segregation ATPase
MNDLDPDLAAAVERTLQLLSDPNAFNRRLAELRGIAASADNKLAEVRAMNQRAADADKVMKDAMALLAKQAEREQAITSRETSLSDREERLAVKVKEAEDDRAHWQAHFAGQKKLLDDRDGALVAAHAALVRMKELLDAERSEFEQTHRKVQDLIPTLH